MKTKKELLKYYPCASLNYDITTDEPYLSITPPFDSNYFNFDRDREIKIKINYKYYNLIYKNIEWIGEFKTCDYIEIIYKAYKEQNREEIMKRWRESRLKIKLKSINKEEVIKTRRKI